MEGVEDCDGVLELVIDRALVALERVQGRDLHTGAEPLTALSEPVGVSLHGSPRDEARSRARTRPCWSRLRSTIPDSSFSPHPPRRTGLVETWCQMVPSTPTQNGKS